MLFLNIAMGNKTTAYRDAIIAFIDRIILLKYNGMKAKVADKLLSPFS